MDFFCFFYDGNCRNIEGITEVRSGMLKKIKKNKKSTTLSTATSQQNE
ncbi:hypothetical protein DPX39_020031700 [Trypanosoma brucei equiperdum]|uniref:Uncharacterized protein n=1 Tax=Trypanosoma brucei equiperdum TaxID=630700 RepID=A0A3L6LBU6_9TRYP|nr:hypothetical protein DPX39_020031700 [Trypanosoma brucei equiperdum]